MSQEKDSGFYLWPGEATTLAQDGLEYLGTSLLELDKFHSQDRLLFYGDLLTTCQAAGAEVGGRCCWVETESEISGLDQGMVNIGFSMEPNGKQAGLSRSLTKLNKDRDELGRLISSGVETYQLRTVQGRVEKGYQQVFNAFGLDISQIVQIGVDEEALMRDKAVCGALKNDSGLILADRQAMGESAVVSGEKNGKGKTESQVGKERVSSSKKTIMGILAGLLPVPLFTATMAIDRLNLPRGQQFIQDVIYALNREQAVEVVGESEAQEPSLYIHEVQPGDTVWDLAQEHGTTVVAIREASKLEDPNFIRVGQTLRIPTNKLPTEDFGVGGVDVSQEISSEYCKTTAMYMDGCLRRLVFRNGDVTPNIPANSGAGVNCGPINKNQICYLYQVQSPADENGNCTLYSTTASKPLELVSATCDGNVHGDVQSKNWWDGSEFRPFSGSKSPTISMEGVSVELVYEAKGYFLNLMANLVKWRGMEWMESMGEEEIRLSGIDLFEYDNEATYKEVFVDFSVRFLRDVLELKSADVEEFMREYYSDEYGEVVSFVLWFEDLKSGNISEYDGVVLETVANYGEMQVSGFSRTDLRKLYAYLQEMHDNSEVIDEVFVRVRPAQITADRFLKDNLNGDDFEGGFPVYQPSQENTILAPMGYYAFGGGYGGEFGPNVLPERFPVIFGAFDVKKRVEGEYFADLAWNVLHEWSLHTAWQGRSEYRHLSDDWDTDPGERKYFDIMHQVMDLVIDVGMQAIVYETEGFDGPHPPIATVVFFASEVKARGFDWKPLVATLAVHGDYDGSIAERWYEEVVVPSGGEIPKFWELFLKSDEEVRSMFDYEEALVEIRDDY